MYATCDIFYALVRAGNFDINNFLLKEDYDGRNFTLVELKGGALEKAFDTDGYIYYLDGKQFRWNKDGVPNEYISTEECDILDVQHVNNILEDILWAKSRFNIIRNAESDEYWKTVRGGKEGYLQRRKERVEKLKSL